MAKRNTTGKERASRSTGAAAASAAARRERAAARNRVVLEPENELPRWLPPLVFAVVTVFIFPEVFFKGNTLFGTDTRGLSYFARNFYTSFVRAHHAFPLWDPMLLGGLPFLEGMHGDIFYPPSLAMFFLPTKVMWAWKMILHVFLAGVFMYLWLRRGMNLRRGPAMFGGVIYMMGAEMISLITPGGDGKLFVSALAPLLFWLTERAVRGRRLSDFAAFALGITLVILTSHMQFGYFCVWGVTSYFFFRVYGIWKAEGDGGAAARLIGLFALAGILGVGAAAIQFLPPLQYVRATSLRADARLDRKMTYDEATSYSLHPEEVMSLAVPEFIGSSDNGYDASGQPRPETYWGRNPFKLNHEYAGFIALLLLPIVFMRRRRREVWYFGGLALFSLLFAVGATTPLFHLFILIPGVKLFRAPSLIIFLFALSTTTLGALALQRMIDWRDGDPDDERAVTRYLWIALAVVAFLAVLATSGILLSFWRALIYDPAQFDPRADAALTANTGRIQLGFWITFGLTGLVAAWWAGLRKGMFNRRVAIALLTLLGAIDLYRVGRPFVRNTAIANDQLAASTPFFTPDPVIQYLQNQAKDPKHIFRATTYRDPQTGNMAYGYSRNQLAIHGIEQAAGLHGNEIGRYAALVGPDASNAFSNLQLLNLLNVEYVVFPGRIQKIELLQEVVSGGYGGAALYRNISVWPRAFLVGAAEVMDDTAALVAIRTQALDLRKTAIVPAAVPGLAAGQGDPQGTVDWIERGDDHMRLRVTSDKPAILVVSDNYYPAWKATIAGKPAEILRVDYTFRGIVVPAGTSEVEMHYDVGHLRFAAITSIVLMLLLLGVFAGGFIRQTPASDEPESAES